MTDVKPVLGAASVEAMDGPNDGAVACKADCNGCREGKGTTDSSRSDSDKGDETVDESQ